MENKKTKIVSSIAIIALVLTVITATYAYFQAQTGEGSQTDVKITSNTVDTLSFETGSSLTFTADQDTFANGKASLSDTTFAKAILTANNKTNSATNNYNLYLNISDNNFTYTQDTSTPELLLQITDASNNSITSIDGLTYKTVTDNKNTSISGFDITNKTGLINLFTNREITTTSTKTEEWTIKITFVNYNKDQSANAGKSFNGQILISKDTFDNYTPNTINTLSATKSGTNLTVNLNVEQGSNEIDKYYYAIEETNGIAMLNNTSKVQRLSNRLAASNLTYIESNSSTYTYTNLSSTKDYKVSAYAVDKRKVKTNTYEYNVYSGSYVYPTISKVETSKTIDSITATVTATKGTNNISKYYYSIDNGSTFIESTSNSYTFSNLSNNSNYRLMIKVADSNNKYSNVYVVNNALDFLEFYLNNVFFIAEKNMTWDDWLDSSYSYNWTWKDKILTYEEVKQKGTWYKNDYEDKNRLITATSSSSSTSLTLYTAEAKAPLSPWRYEEGIILMKNQSIKNSFSELYDYVKKNLLDNEVSENDLNDNKYYVNTFTQACLTPDTLIDVEEIDEKGKKRRRRKKLKDIKVGDKVICINPKTLELDIDTVVECDGTMNKKHTCYDNWYFSDGTIITTVHRHRFYNVENNKFMYMDEWNIGNHGLNINNEKIELIKHEHIEEEINHCTLFTEKYNNYFANGLLSGNRHSKKIIKNHN